ncbi:MAG: hypothetical protein ACI9MR_000546 [Myxococcota bacterium]|jgi:hypothetical protein
MSDSTSILSLAQPFRDAYLDHAAITAQLNAWVAAFPSTVRLTSIGTTEEGRDLWVLTIGPDPDRHRPGVWVDANMHASELCGSSVALAIAEDLIRLHTEPGSTIHGLPDAACERLRDVLVYVMPRLSPDGGERLLKTARFVRSSPRDGRPNQAHPHWEHGDLDGNGLALQMRLEDPHGEYVANPRFPSLLQPRTIEDEGPFFRLYPEGTIANFDGDIVPDPYYLSDNGTDLNRNFFVGWQSEPYQAGAGVTALSEPESRAVVDFTAAHPNIYAWLNLHCFGGVVIRPPGDKPDSAMHPDELALYEQLAAWSDTYSGYPTVSGFEEFTYEPDKPLAGDIVAYAYKARGCFAWVVELWDLFARLGLERPKRFVDYYNRMTTDDLETLYVFDREHNAGRLFVPWVPVEHPQLGPVEVGGVDPRVGLWNPPYEEIGGVCDAQSAIFLRVAAMCPQVAVATSVSDTGVVEVSVQNTGYMPTYGLPSAKPLPFNEPLWVECAVEDGLTLVDPTQSRLDVGHLEGWGRGRFHGGQSLLFPQTRGSSNRRTLRIHTQGAGQLKVRVGSCRVGWQDITVAV